jgi:energy-coupling factor transport system ATP-binding protein
MLIQVERLTHTYAADTPLAHEALHEVSLEIGPGERVGILGPTGSGKTTLVQHLAGLLIPASGQVRLDGVAAHKRTRAARACRRRIGLAFQYPEDQIFEQTVSREVAFGPRNYGVDKTEVDRRVRWALGMVGLDAERFADRSPLILSGGEMRRVALAAILSSLPEVLILDEPTAGLDPQGRRNLLSRIRAWQQETGLTLILVSHNLDELARVVDRVLLLNQGRIVADGPVRGILGDTKRLRAAGLSAPAPVTLLYALKEAGWPVRTDLLLPEEAAVEINRVQMLRERA